MSRALFNLARRALKDASVATGTASQGYFSRAAEFSPQSHNPSSSSSKAKWGGTTIGAVMKAKIDSGSPTAALFYTDPDSTVFEAVKKMAAANVGSIVVLNGAPTQPGSVAGIITERDYMRNVVVAGKNSKDMFCKSLMTPVSKLLTLTSNDTMLTAMNLMEEYNIRHIPIIDNGMLQGMLSIKDVVATLISEHNAEVESMSEYIGGSY